VKIIIFSSRNNVRHNDLYDIFKDPKKDRRKGSMKGSRISVSRCLKKGLPLKAAES
jgi:hypothetical protein